MCLCKHSGKRIGKHFGWQFATEFGRHAGQHVGRILIGNLGKSSVGMLVSMMVIVW